MNNLTTRLCYPLHIIIIFHNNYMKLKNITYLNPNKMNTI
jgi:hypothetical protein